MDSGIEMILSLTKKQAESFLDVYLKLPEDKRTQLATAKSPSASDQIAEIAITNRRVSSVLENLVFPSEFDYSTFVQQKAELCTNWDELLIMFHSSLKVLDESIKRFDPTKLEQIIEYPWGKTSMREVISSPFWNMAYHEGQVAFIATMLDVEL